MCQFFGHPLLFQINVFSSTTQKENWVLLLNSIVQHKWKDQAKTTISPILLAQLKLNNNIIYKYTVRKRHKNSASTQNYKTFANHWHVFISTLCIWIYSHLKCQLSPLVRKTNIFPGCFSFLLPQSHPTEIRESCRSRGVCGCSSRLLCCQDVVDIGKKLLGFCVDSRLTAVPPMAHLSNSWWGVDLYIVRSVFRYALRLYIICFMVADAEVFGSRVWGRDKYYL